MPGWPQCGHKAGDGKHAKRHRKSDGCTNSAELGCKKMKMNFSVFRTTALSITKNVRAAVVLTMLVSTSSVFAQTNAGGTEISAPLQPLRSEVVAAQLFADLARQNALRTADLVGYSTTRTYEVKDLKGKVHAREIGVMEYHAPDKKTFTLRSEDGSGLVRRLALNPLIASEIEASSGKQHHDSSITPDNYELVPLGEQRVGNYDCYVAEAIPKRHDKYLFEGKVWIDVQDHAIVRIEGHPAKRPSFWIERADFVREYQKIDGFWFPKRDETLVHVRMYGTKILTIDHADYVVHGVADKQQAVQTPAVVSELR